MSDDEYDTHCPLCVEEMDLSDQNFLPCPCGYKVCMWCWHHIRENMNGLCPACRTPYNSDPHAFSAVDREDIVKLKKEKRQKEKQEKKTAERVIVATPGVQVKSTASTVMDRKHLHNYRVVQRNLVYVIGVPAAYASEDTLRKPEFFGQYGKIGKVVIHRNHSSAHSTVSVYVTFTYKEDARASIQSLDGHWLDQNHLLRASFGTTKYCNNFIRGVPCNNPECVYLHDLGDDDDRFTKEEIQAGHSKIPPVPGKDQTLVTGGGGPSGTGKRPLGEPYLPPPVFIQDNYPSSTPMVPMPVPVAAPPASTTSTGSTLAAPPGVGVGIVMGVGRPAAVSRSGTATWGTANTIAAIIGGDANAVSGALMSLTDRERDRDRPRSNSNTPVNFPPLSLSTATSSNNLQEEVYRAGGSSNSSSVPTAVLKRSASNSVGASSSALDPTPAGAAASAAAARAAPIAPLPSTSNATASNTSSTTTATPAAVTAAPSTSTTASTATTTTPAAAPSAPAVVAPVKPKAKTQKEINAEKKAAAAAARAAEKALMAEAAAAAAAERAALAAAAMAAGGDGESKSNGPIVPTPKLSAKQQMLANKAEKAAKAQAAALAAQEVREAARLLRETARAAAQAERGNNKEETKPQSRAERKAHQAALALAAAQNAANAAAASSSPVAIAAPSTPATPAQSNDTQDLSILTQVAAPSIANAPLPSLSSMTDAPPTYAQVRGFNGLSVNTLFPVPASSLSCSVWGNILRATNEDLLINPYGQLKVPMSELLDLMLPPVDAMLSSAPCWPRPLAYYSQGMQPGGVTFSPAGKHVHVRSAADMAALPPMVQMLPPSLQSASVNGNGSGRNDAPSLSPAQLAAQAQQHSRVNMLLSAISAEPSEPEPVMPPMASLPVLLPATTAGAPPLGPPPGVALPGSSTTAGGYVRSNGRTAGPSPLGPPPGVSVNSGSAGSGGNGGGTNINALRQLFPGVKMSVSASK